MLAFIDYDNVRVAPERTALDVALNLTELLDRLTDSVGAAFPAATEIDARLYGGWVGEDGRYSRLAEWTFGALHQLRGRRNGIRLRPQMVISAACQPRDVLIGTVRLLSRPKRQKMVDGLLTIDALHLSDEEADFLLVSDDDDFVPAAMALRSATARSCFILRLRGPGQGLNDVTLSRNGIGLATLRIQQPEGGP